MAGIILSFRERQERIAARADEYRARQLTVEQFRASLYALGLRRDDITHTMNENAPIPIRDAEQDRYEASIDWLREYLGRHK